jgi:hypothetical protein
MSDRSGVTTKQITIGKLRFADTDARSEILPRDENKKKFFIESFYVPEKLRIAIFFDRRQIFYLWAKGTGKTALLRYINEHFLSSHLLKKREALTPFLPHVVKCTFSDIREADMPAMLCK